MTKPSTKLLSPVFNEKADALRLRLRTRLEDANKKLSSLVRTMGVIEPEQFEAVFNAGYEGLYGGRIHSVIKQHKNIPTREDLPDRMGIAELKANLFRIKTAYKVIAEHRPRGVEEVCAMHRQLGQELREHFKRHNGSYLETLPPVAHIKQVRQRMEKAQKEKTVPAPRRVA